MMPRFDPSRLSREDLERALEDAYQDDGRSEPGVTATKAHASAAGAGIGAAVAQIVVHLWPDMGPVELPLTILITAAFGWVATYLAPANRLR